MSFLSTLVLLAASSALVVSLPCVVPPLLQGTMLTLEYVAGDSTKPSVQISRFAYDALGETIISTFVKDDGSSYKILKYYRKKIQYKINSEGKCMSKPLKEAFPRMLIPKSDHEFAFPKGTRVYTGSTIKGRFAISVKGKCLPFSWTEYKPLGGNKYLVQQRHMSDVSGKVDLNTFKLPGVCVAARFILPW